MWTEKLMDEYAVYLDFQEQLVLAAVARGFDVDETKDFVLQTVGDFADLNFVESVYNVATHPDRKIALQD